MSVKHFVLLLIFLLNSAATALADSVHIEMEVHTVATEHSTDHHDHADVPASSDEHCPEHDACHSGHYHHYLTSELMPSIGCTFSSTIGFRYPQSFYVSNFLEIIKPPILHS